MKVSAVGIPWYHEADYNALREMFEDGHKLAATYEEWLETANGLFEHLKNSGVMLVKAYIKPEEFPAWCAAHNLRLDSDGRKAFANEVAARTHLDQS